MRVGGGRRKRRCVGRPGGAMEKRGQKKVSSARPGRWRCPRNRSPRVHRLAPSLLPGWQGGVAPARQACLARRGEGKSVRARAPPRRQVVVVRDGILLRRTSQWRYLTGSMSYTRVDCTPPLRCAPHHLSVDVYVHHCTGRRDLSNRFLYSPVRDVDTWSAVFHGKAPRARIVTRARIVRAQQPVPSQSFSCVTVAHTVKYSLSGRKRRAPTRTWG